MYHLHQARQDGVNVEREAMGDGSGDIDWGDVGVGAAFLLLLVDRDARCKNTNAVPLLLV